MISPVDQISGHKIIYLDSVTSTNDYLKNIADNNIEEGTVVIAETQTDGRGRNGKKWISPKGKGLTFSILLYPKIKLNQVLIFSYIPVIVLTKVLIQQFNLFASIKWPNDVYVNNKKIAGILSESVIYKKSLKYFIAGIGINLNQNLNDFSDELQEVASSLRIILKKNIDKEFFLFNFLKEFDILFQTIKISSNWENDIVNEWHNLCNHINSRVQLISKNDNFYGVFKGITKTGEAIIKTDQNIIKTVNIDNFSLR